MQRARAGDHCGDSLGRHGSGGVPSGCQHWKDILVSRDEYPFLDLQAHREHLLEVLEGQRDTTWRRREAG